MIRGIKDLYDHTIRVESFLIHAGIDTIEEWKAEDLQSVWQTEIMFMREKLLLKMDLDAIRKEGYGAQQADDDS